MINRGFWDKIKKPIFSMAPMLDVTDEAFRFMIAKYGSPDVLFTEFVSCDGLCSEGKDHIIEKHLGFDESERPIVAQLFGNNLDTFRESAKIIKELGFDGIDINTGCPQKNIIKQGAGSDLIRHPKLIKEIIKATKEGAGDLPVSIKTRIGFGKDETVGSRKPDNWVRTLLETEPAVITIHGRTKKEMTLVPCHWDAIGRAVEIAKEYESSENNRTLIFGNGDVWSLDDAKEKIKQYGVDGVMIGRGVFGNPWFFNPETKKEDLEIKEILKVILEHTRLFEKKLGKITSFNLMKKHYKAYVSGFDGARELRTKLMETKNADEVEKIVKSWK